MKKELRCLLEQYNLLKNVSSKRPVCSPRNCDYNLRTDLITLHYQIHPLHSQFNKWQLACNGKIITSGTGFITMQNTLQNMEELLDSVYPKKDVKFLIFINRLGVLKNILPAGETQCFKSGLSFGNNNDLVAAKDPIDLISKRFVFRNFTILANEINVDRIGPMFKETEPALIMTKFIESFDCPVHKVNYSLAYMTVKQFFDDGLAKECWRERVRLKDLFKSTQTYLDMFAGSKAGALRKFNESTGILNNVVSFDKKSAYPSAMVNDNLFPLGTINRVNCKKSEKLAMIKAKIRGSQWCKVVIRPKEPIPELAIFRTKNELSYGLEYYDIMLYDMLRGLDNSRPLEVILQGIDCWTLYCSEFTGYLFKPFRDKIIEFFDLKNSITDKECFERAKIKTGMDMLYGKGIQWRDVNKKTDVRSVNNIYKFHGERYLLPQHSMHCISAVRYEIYYLVVALDDFGVPVVAYDTDGIKVLWTEETDGMIFGAFDCENLKIQEKTLAAGYESSIGEWDFEGHYKRFLQLRTKCYLYEDEDNELVCKLAGIDKDILTNWMKDKSDDIIKYFNNNYVEIPIPNNYKLNTKTGLIEPIMIIWTYDGIKQEVNYE